jgi:hypothetical protein
MADTKAVNGNIEFTTKSGSYIVDIASLKVVIQFERHFNVSAQVMNMAPRVEYLAYMAWAAARAQNMPVADTFDGFVDELVDIEQVDGEQTDQNPTDGGQ